MLYRLSWDFGRRAGLVVACFVTSPVQDITKDLLVAHLCFCRCSCFSAGSGPARLQLHRAACPLRPSVRHWEQINLQRCEGLHCALEAIPFSWFAAAVSDPMPQLLGQLSSFTGLLPPPHPPALAIGSSLLSQRAVVCWICTVILKTLK